jgi:hypothetical protein
MGLQQKRIIQEYQETVFPGWKKQFDEACGFEIPMEVRWETMQSDDRDKKENYFPYYDEVYFRPLLSAFKGLCSDQMGKDAVKAGVKKIVIESIQGGGTQQSSFNDGVFSLKHNFTANYYDEESRAKDWKKLIEAKL